MSRDCYLQWSGWICLTSHLGSMSAFSCLHSHHWPMAYLMTLSDWLMSCQVWPPRDRYGEWARCKHWRPALYFFDWMAWFNGVYLRYCHANSTAISKWHKKNRCLLHWCKISRWYDEKLLCCRRVKNVSLQRTNNEPANVLTCIRERHLGQYLDE